VATLSRIRVHPIKALDPEEPETVRISEVGGLAGDRSYAIVDGNGRYVNGKLTAAVHRLRSSVDLARGVVELRTQEDDPGPGAGDVEPARFELDGDREALEVWLSDYFGVEVAVEAAAGGDLADSRVYSDVVAGATVVSTATLREVASWFPDVDVESVRRRFRANLEVDGVEAFWEDRLVPDGTGPDGSGPRLRIGDVTFQGVKHVNRCVVPTRDPYTGADTEGFRERFVRKREETFPEWADRDAFDHFYALTTLVHPGEADWDGSIAVGNEVELLDG